MSVATSRFLARHYAAMARRAHFMERDRKKARALAFKALACLAMMELDISPRSPFIDRK